MNELIQWGGHPVVHRLGWTLLHFLWQGAVIAGLFAIAHTGRPKRFSNARYLTGCLALLLLVAAPLITFVVLGVERAIPAALSASGARSSPASAHLLSTTAGALPPNIRDEPLRPPLPAAPNLNPPSAPLLHLEKFIPAFVFVWLLGVSVLSVRLLFSSLQVARLKRRGNEPAGPPWMERLRHLQTALGISRPIRLVKSALVEVPTVVGWLRPVILLPAATLAGLTPAQLESILAHELAHIRRHDYLVNLLQNALETLLFYHPAVWWVSSCVRAEREICCDEIAVQLCGDRLAYAQALTALEQLRAVPPSLALGADGGSLLERIRRLTGAPSGGSFPGRRRAGGMLVAALLAVIFVSLLHHPSSNAKAQETRRTMDSGQLKLTMGGKPSAATNQTNAAPGPGNSSKPAANPSGISLMIRCTTNIFKVGEEIPVEFTITNHGTADYKYSGRNYDRGGRMGEYKLIAKTISGESVPDPRQHFKPGMGGGPAMYNFLHPGASFSRVIALNLWALIKEPGRYEVVGTYGYDPGSVKSDPISITVLPRTKEEMDDYIQGLTNQIAARLAALAAYQATHPSGLTPELADPELRRAMMSLMYTCSPESIPTLLRIMFESSDSFWAIAALADYVPHTKESRKALLEAAAKHGLNGGMGEVLQAYDFDNKAIKPVIERALAADNPGEWRAGVWLALRYYDEAFTTRLISIACDPTARGDTRSIAMRVLMFHRTDEGVKAIKTLLKNPAPEMLEPLNEAIANGYANRDMSPTGRPLQPQDSSAEDLRPLIERLLVSTNQALALQLSGVILAKSFGSDALTAQLVALTTNPSPYTRAGAIYALALNRTDEGVKVLKSLLHDPNPETSKMAEGAIRNAYTSRGDARGRPLRPDDFDAKFQQPEVTLATNSASTNKERTSPSSGLNRTHDRVETPAQHTSGNTNVGKTAPVATSQTNAASGPVNSSKTWRVTGHVFDANTKEPVPHFLIIPGMHTAPYGWPVDWDVVNYVEGTNGSFVIYLDNGTTNHALNVVADGYHWRNASPQLPGSTICDFPMDKSPPGFGDDGRYTQDAFNLDSLLAPPRSEPIQKFVGARICAITAPDGEPAALVTAYLLPRAAAAGVTLSVNGDGELRGGSIPHRMVRADLTGRFAIPVSDVDIASLVIAGPAGFKVVPGRELMEGNTVNRNIALERWGRIKGTLRRGSLAAGGEVVGLEFLEGSGLPGTQFCLTNRAATDPRGRFEFDHAPAGKVRLVLFEKAGTNMPEHPGLSLQITVASGQTVETNFDLAVPGALNGTVLLPNGQPAAGAQVGFAAPNEPIWLKGSNLSHSTGHEVGAPIARTDAQGRFHLPAMESADSMESADCLIAAHDGGYCKIEKPDLKAPLTIRLEAWGRIEGTLHVGKSLGAHEAISFIIDIHPPLGPTLDARDSWRVTDAGGSFVFEHLPPGKVWLTHIIRFGNGDGGSSGWTHALVKPGVVTKVEMGGDGRRVIGHAVKGAGTAFDWDQAQVQLHAPLPYQDDKPRTFRGAITGDGSFRVDDVPPGTYTLTLNVSSHRRGSHVFRSGFPAPVLTEDVTVPEVSGGQSDTPVDLGTFQIGSATNNVPSNPPPADQPSSRGSSNAPSAINGTVLLPSGQPAAGAELVLQLTNDLLFLDVAKGFLTENGMTNRPEDGAQIRSAFATADAGGHFHLPPMENVAALLAIHPQGFTWMAPGDLKADVVVRLQPLGRIEGTFHLGTQPGGDEKISLNANEPRLHLFSNAADTMTDGTGRFVFTNLPAIRFRLTRMFREDPSETDHGKGGINTIYQSSGHYVIMTSSRDTWINNGDEDVLVKGGGTTEVELGGTGRPVVGKLTKAGMAFKWNQAYVKLSQQALPKPEIGWHLARVADDGTFRAENVGAGGYDLAVYVSPDDGKSNVLYPGGPFSVLTRNVVVPEVAGGRSVEPLDLGSLEIQHPRTERRIKVGEQAPAITATNSVPLFGGEPLNPADDLGKYVLLDLCGNYFDSDLPFLRAAHDTFAANSRLVIKTITLGYILEDRFHAGLMTRTLPWSYLYTGPIQMADWAEAYGLLDQNSMVRQIVLIGPDGKIVAWDLHGDAIKAAIAEVLLKR